MGNYQDWWNELHPHTKEYLKNQPIWRDSDLAKFCAITFVAGIIIGAIATWHY